MTAGRVELRLVGTLAPEANHQGQPADDALVDTSGLVFLQLVAS